MCEVCLHMRTCVCVCVCLKVHACVRIESLVRASKARTLTLSFVLQSKSVRARRALTQASLCLMTAWCSADLASCPAMPDARAGLCTFSAECACSLVCGRTCMEELESAAVGARCCVSERVGVCVRVFVRVSCAFKAIPVCKYLCVCVCVRVYLRALSRCALHTPFDVHTRSGGRFRRALSAALMQFRSVRARSAVTMDSLPEPHAWTSAVFSSCIACVRMCVCVY